MGKLTLLATPIGNLGDITENVKEALFSDSVFAVEDTRTFKNLLNALNIPLGNKSIISLLKSILKIIFWNGKKS